MCSRTWGIFLGSGITAGQGVFFPWFWMSWNQAHSDKSRWPRVGGWSCIQLATWWWGQWHQEELKNTLHVLPQGRQRARLWWGWSLSKSFGIPDPTKSTCQAKVCMPRKCSRLSWLRWRAVALLRTSFCLVESKFSSTHFSCVLLRTRPLCNRDPWDSAGCPEHLHWDV